MMKKKAFMGVCCFMAAVLTISTAEALDSYTVSLLPFQEGLELATGAIRRDPAVLIVICGNEEDIEYVVKFDGELTGFAMYPNVELSFQFDAIGKSALFAFFEQDIQFAILENTKIEILDETSLNGLSFQDINMGRAFAITPSDVIAFNTANSMSFLQVRDYQGGFSPVSADVAHIQYDPGTIPEPGTITLFGLGLSGCLVFFRQKWKYNSSKTSATRS